MSGAKRPATDQAMRTATEANGAAASGPNGNLGGGPLGNLPATVGSEEHERPVIEAMAMALRDLSMEVQSQKTITMDSWEITNDNPYIRKAMLFKEEYMKLCRQSKGKE